MRLSPKTHGVFSWETLRRYRRVLDKRIAMQFWGSLDECIAFIHASKSPQNLDIVVFQKRGKLKLVNWQKSSNEEQQAS